MSAMKYESLLCSVYNCGRGGVKGADVNFYRAMELAERFLTDTKWNRSQEIKEQEYKKAFLEVSRFVRTALLDGLEKIMHRATEEDMRKLEEMQETLHQPHFYNKSALDTIIDTARVIFAKNGLEKM